MFPNTVNRSKLMYLKSNMDRFIGNLCFPCSHVFEYLKSNMDRFIENIAEYQLMFAVYLKSNMDRFIGLGKQKMK